MDPSRHELRLAPCNGHSGIGTTGCCDLAQMAEVGMELAADVLVLQQGESRHGDLELLKSLEAQTGMTTVPEPTIMRTVGALGKGLLTYAMALSRQAQTDLSQGSQ